MCRTAAPTNPVARFFVGIMEFFVDVLFSTRREEKKSVADSLRDQLNDKRVEVVRLNDLVESERLKNAQLRESLSLALCEADARIVAVSADNRALRARISALEDAIASVRRGQGQGKRKR